MMSANSILTGVIKHENIVYTVDSDINNLNDRNDTQVKPLHIRRTSSSFNLHTGRNMSQSISVAQPLCLPSNISRSLTLPHRRRRSSAQDKLHVIPDATPLDEETVAKLRRWIQCIVVGKFFVHFFFYLLNDIVDSVDFDVDEGPTVRGIFPPLRLSVSQQQNLAFLSFPDSLTSDEGEEKHSFRMRDLSRHGFVHGFAQFSQHRDSLNKRGYTQRSLVILTNHPWPGIFFSLICTLGPMYLRHGSPMLEIACHNIANWPDPAPGSTLELGFLGSVLHIHLPGNAEKPQQSHTVLFEEKYDPNLHVLASAAPSLTPSLVLFGPSISHMWSIWECLLLGEPLIIYGQTPSTTSQAIWWFLDILRPLIFAGDYRPYLTIHDKDYSSFVNKRSPKSGLLLGVTNPFVLKSCAHWPHILSLGYIAKNSNLSASHPPGWYTKTHNRSVAKDLTILEKLLSFIESGSMDQGSALLYQHFSRRTAEFFVPLNRFINTLIPSPAELTNHFANAMTQNSALPLNLPVLRPFNNAQFLASLDTQHSPLRFRLGKEKKFYERWLKSPAFGLWLADQEHIVRQEVSRQVKNM